MLIGFTGLNCVWLGLTKFYRVLRGLTGFDWVWLSLTGFDWVWLSLTGFDWVLIGLTGFDWVLLGFTGLNWVLPSFTWLGWFSEPIRIDPQSISQFRGTSRGIGMRLCDTTRGKKNNSVKTREGGGRGPWKYVESCLNEALDTNVDRLHTRKCSPHWPRPVCPATFYLTPPHLLSSAEKSFEKKLGKIRAAFNVCKNIMLHCEWGQILYKTQYHYIFKCKDQVDNHTCLVKKIEGKNHYNKIFKSKN